MKWLLIITYLQSYSDHAPQMQTAWAPASSLENCQTERLAQVFAVGSRANQKVIGASCVALDNYFDLDVETGVWSVGGGVDQ